jgi:disulfide oxidoreductase YuzD
MDPVELIRKYRMKTVKIMVELTVDLYTAEEVKDWLEDVIESNFSEENEKILSIELVE